MWSPTKWRKPVPKWPDSHSKPVNGSQRIAEYL
jgi:hypothetical protein